MKPITVNVSLEDVYQTRCAVKTTIEFFPLNKGIGLKFNKYGDYCSIPGEGIPVIIEIRDGIPYVVVWADINQEDPTHEISLEHAHEHLRREKE